MHRACTFTASLKWRRAIAKRNLSGTAGFISSQSKALWGGFFVYIRPTITKGVKIYVRKQ